jgi:hypothetical protein
VKSLPVTREGRIVGIVFRGAVFEAIAEEILKQKRVEAAAKASAETRAFSPP